VKLYRVGDTSWYVLVDTAKQEIVSQHEKGQVQATVNQLQTQVDAMPNPSVMEQDLKDLLTLVDNFAGATKERKDRVKKLVSDMWQHYQGEPQLVERAELRSRLDREKALLAQMEA
jgi:hypothetical protein